MAGHVSRQDECSYSLIARQNQISSRQEASLETAASGFRSQTAASSGLNGMYHNQRGLRVKFDDFAVDCSLIPHEQNHID